MTILKVKTYAVRDANTMRRLVPMSFVVESHAEKEADKLRRKGKAAIVVPVEG